MQNALLSMDLPYAQVQLPPLTAQMLRKYLSKASGVPGPCGWTSAEMRSLPDAMLQQLADIYGYMESCGVALEVNCHGDVALIPKEEGELDVEQLRPIPILSYIHRVYAGARLREGLLQWQELILQSRPIKACRQAASTFDPTLAAAALLELSHHQDAQLHAVSYDLRKAFDSMPFPAGVMQGFGWRLLRRMGFPAGAQAVMFDQHARMQRRFNVLQHLGPSTDS